MIYDFYTADTWLDSCDTTQYDPARLLVILVARWADVRMVRRGEVNTAPVESFADWLKSLSQSERAGRQ